MAPSKIRAEQKQFGGGKGGRPKGDLSRRSRQIRAVTDRHIKGKRLPLDVLMENMIHYQDEARAITEHLAELLKGKELKQLEGDQIVQVMEYLAQIGDARMRAGHFAAQAAPYIHPRLSAIQMGVRKVEHPRDLPDSATDEEFIEEFRKLRSQPYVPPVVEGD